MALNCGQEAVLNCSGSTVNSSKHSDGRILEDVLRGLGNSSPTCTGLGSGLIHPVTRACGHAQNPAEDSTAIRELTFRSTRRSPKTHLQTRFRERSSSILGSGHVQTLHSQRNEIHVRLIQHQGVGWAAGLLITARKIGMFHDITVFWRPSTEAVSWKRNPFQAERGKSKKLMLNPSSLLEFARKSPLVLVSTLPRLTLLA